MLSRLPEYKQMSRESQLRVEAFYQRFCAGKLGLQYGLGHLVYAAHAAFPLMLSPELANLVWVNFRNFYYLYNNEPTHVEQIAVSDFLMSPLCRQLNKQYFEVIPDIRSFLLFLLNEGSFFTAHGIRNEGKSRITELANFLEQYLARKTTPQQYDGTAFRKLNSWAVDAWTKPQSLADELLDSFNDYVVKGNEKGQLWLTLQMEKVKQQYDNKLSGVTNGNQLAAFNRLYFYGKARKEQLYHQRAEKVYDYSKEIANFIEEGVSVGKQEYNLPLMKEAVERTERKVKKVQKVFCLAVGIDEYPGLSNLKSTYTDAHVIIELLETLVAAGSFEVEHVILTGEKVTKQGVLDNLSSLYRKANPEDIVFFYFSGFASRDIQIPGGFSEQSRPVDVNRIMMPDFKQEDDNTFITDREFSDLISVYNRKNAHTVVMLDANTGYYNWAGPNGVFIGSTRYGYGYESSELRNGLFSLELKDIITKTKGKVTYRDLITYLRFKVASNATRQLPILYGNEEFYNRCFLTQLDTPGSNHSLIAFNKQTESWEVLEPYFKVELPGEQAYASNRLAGDTRMFSGSVRFAPSLNKMIFVDDGIERMDTGMFYMLETHEKPMYVQFGHRTDLEAALVQIQHHAFPLWDHFIIAGEPLQIPNASGAPSDCFAVWRFPGDSGQLAVLPGTNDKHYTLRIDSEYSQSLKKNLTIPELTEHITRFANFYNLSQPYLKKAEERELRISVSFVRGKEEFFISPATLSTEINKLMYIEKDKILFHPFKIMIHNDEDFPLFARCYFLGSDFSVHLVPGDIQIPSKEASHSEYDITEVATIMLEQNIWFRFKVLISRDPVRIGLSQINNYSITSSY